MSLRFEPYRQILSTVDPDFWLCDSMFIFETLLVIYAPRATIVSNMNNFHQKMQEEFT